MSDMEYRDSWELSTIPQEVFYSEVARRRSISRTPDQQVGPAKVMRACPHCRRKMGARELKAHQPHCERKK